MRLGVVADVHLWNHRAFPGEYTAGLNDRFRAGLKSLEAALRGAEAEGCTDFAIAGDLFDGVAPSPQMLRAVQDALWTTKMNVHVLTGNHDRVSELKGDHALGPLEADGVLTVYEVPGMHLVDQNEVWFVPHIPGVGSENVLRALSELKAKSAAAGGGLPRRRALVLHYGIADGDTPGFLARADDCVRADWLMAQQREFGISVTLAGNWHRSKTWMSDDGFAVVQVGALAPRDFRDEGAAGYGGLAVFDFTDDEVTLREIPGDRFVIVHSVQEQEAAGAEVPTASRLFLRRIGVEGSAAVGEPDGVEDTPNMRDAEIATRAAAGAARGTDTLLEALSAFVGEMPLDAGVDRKAVLARCHGFLKGAEG